MLDIEKYEAMAMLDLPDAERVIIRERLGAITKGFNTLDMVETEGVEPLISVLDVHSVLRDDISEKLLSRDELMTNAPEQYDGYFQVPGTLE